ncbi:unnamed protein product, partial [Laminaria digitata]
QQQKRRQRPGFPVGSGSKREKLPSAPPAMSARCQVHPALLKDLGASPGDPVLVLTLAEGWLSDATPPPAPLLTPTGSGGGGGGEGVTPASATSKPRHTGEEPGGDVEGAAERDRDDGDDGGGGGGAGSGDCRINLAG